MGNVTGILLLIFFVYAVLGVQFFSHVRMNKDINHMVNFRTFPRAMLLLFEVAAGVDWPQMMHQCRIDEPLCTSMDMVNHLHSLDATPEELGFPNGLPTESDCGNNWMSRMYFFSFWMLIINIFLTLFFAVVIDTYNTCKERENWPISIRQINLFPEVWAEWDPACSGKIASHQLWYFLRSLGQREKQLEGAEIKQPLGLAIMSDGSGRVQWGKSDQWQFKKVVYHMERMYEEKQDGRRTIRQRASHRMSHSHDSQRSAAQNARQSIGKSKRKEPKYDQVTFHKLLLNLAYRYTTEKHFRPEKWPEEHRARNQVERKILEDRLTELVRHLRGGMFTPTINPPTNKRVFVNEKGAVSSCIDGPFSRVSSSCPLREGTYKITNELHGKYGETVEIEVDGAIVTFVNPRTNNASEEICFRAQGNYPIKNCMPVHDFNKIKDPELEGEEDVVGVVQEEEDIDTTSAHV